MKKTNKRYALSVMIVIALVLAIALLSTGCSQQGGVDDPDSTASVVPSDPVADSTVVETGPTHEWVTGYIATLDLDAAYCSDEGVTLGSLSRGTQVEYELTADGRCAILLDDSIVYLQDGMAAIAADIADVVPIHTQFVRTSVNLRDVEGRLLDAFAEKGSSVNVTGYDYLLEDGEVHMYRVNFNGEEGYIMPWYLVDSETDALANYDDGSYSIHAARENIYGGGGAADLDYYPREKGPIDGNEMPSECRTLYLTCWRLGQVEDYIEIADNCGINAFVVDIIDGGSIGYAADVLNQYSPAAAAAAQNTVEDYQAAIQKLKDAGYYVIGRITTFNDSYFVKEHPECAIISTSGEPLKMSGEYWPSPFNRTAWQYKVDLAVEAVELMGFNEIQFDYVRFPDSMWRYEKAGTVDARNTYDETKAQAIQRFLMYATDILHEKGVYVSADVYGESAFTYVTAYGQYWPAISNVVDAISGMPYPDHFGAEGAWLPWEHPYETLNNWGKSVMARQSETATPAAVRTWIQAYNAIREPYNTYGPDEVYAQIKGLRDAGCTGGYMTWNSASSLEKYRWLMPAFDPPAEEQ